MMALLQPSPEIFRLFDDVMLLSDGICIYYGQCSDVLPFFRNMGFQCPPRMAIPGFLQNITSSKDQQVSDFKLGLQIPKECKGSHRPCW